MYLNKRTLIIQAAYQFYRFKRFWINMISASPHLSKESPNLPSNKNRMTKLFLLCHKQFNRKFTIASQSCLRSFTKIKWHFSKCSMISTNKKRENLVKKSSFIWWASSINTCLRTRFAKLLTWLTKTAPKL
jgi:hypothetical protein